MMSILENVCPACTHKNDLEAVVCGHCGVALDDPFMDPGAKTKTTDMPALVPHSRGDEPKDWSFAAATIPAHGIAMYVEGASGPAYIDASGEVVIGRKAEGTSEGLLDLAPFGGYHLGLSRRHAVIRRTEHGYEVLDLGSVNGTWLNDERLVPHKAYPLTSGSHLRLGSMRLFVLYRPLAEPR
jgi:hypothetical protein